jgi:hypothetical protein
LQQSITRKILPDEHVATFADSLVRRLRYGAPIIVVSGLPRSGTSMMMRMLEAGGVPIVTDDVRLPDVNNPNGYYEFERVKELDKGIEPAWLRDARGRAVKIVSQLLTWLPESYDYRVILMQRDLDETIASQHRMLLTRGESTDGDVEQLRRAYERHLEQVSRFLARRPCFVTLPVSHRSVIEQPDREAARIGTFLGRTVDTTPMAAAVNPDLYRNRRTEVATHVGA